MQSSIWLKRDEIILMFLSLTLFPFIQLNILPWHGFIKSVQRWLKNLVTKVYNR